MELVVKIALTGTNGMLGSSFLKLLDFETVDLIPRHELYDHNPDQLRKRVHACDLLINCAADTDVEGAELAPEAAFAANSILPARLAAFCRSGNTILMHWSSTGCYGDWKDEPYTEEDIPRPKSIHHRSKIWGEREVRDSGCEHLIFRTGWLYGGAAGGAKNFVWKRMLEARGKTHILSDREQRGTPTFAFDAARQAMAAYAAGVRGTSNLTAHGTASRFDYVSQIVSRTGLPCLVEPGQAFARRAPVSHNEVALNLRLKLLGVDCMPDWREPVDQYVDALMTSPEWHALEG